MMSSRVGTVGVVVAVLLLLAGCGNDEARQLFDDGVRLGSEGRYEEAMAKFREVETRFPRSELASQARREVQSLNDLLSAGQRYRPDRAVELVRDTTRAVERFQADQGRLPRHLGELVPRWIGSLEKDPWGRPIRFARSAEGYRVYCLGADGEKGGSGDDQDVVVINGEFQVRPPGSI